MTTGHNLPGWQSGVHRKSKLLVCEMPIQVYVGMVPLRAAAYPPGGGANPGHAGGLQQGSHVAIQKEGGHMPTTGLPRGWRFRFHWSVCSDSRAPKLTLRLHNIVISAAKPQPNNPRHR